MNYFKPLLLVLLINASRPFYSQVDVFDYETVGIHANYKSTHHKGFYGRTDNIPSTQAIITTANVLEGLSDKGSALNLDLTYTRFEDSFFQTFNTTGLIYFFSGLVNFKSNHSGMLYYALMKQVTTPSPNLLAVPNPVDYTKPSRFWCFDLIGHTTSIGKKSLNIGYTINIKQMGLTGPFTWFVDKTNTYVYRNLVGETTKLVGGPNIAYRKSFNSVSVVVLGGVNFCPNSFGKANYAIKYNPFVNLTLFAGKKIGATITFKYEYIKGINKIGMAKYNTGQASNETVYRNEPTNVSQMELKFGFYYKAGWFRKFLTRSRN